MPKFKILEDGTRFTYRDQMERVRKRQEERDNKILGKAIAREAKFINDELRRREEEYEKFDEKKHFIFEQHLAFINSMMHTKKQFIFLTLNFDTNLVTPGGTLAIVKNILDYKLITKAYAFWEWRNVIEEGGSSLSSSTLRRYL